MPWFSSFGLFDNSPDENHALADLVNPRAAFYTLYWTLSFQAFDRRAAPTPQKPFATIQRDGKLITLSRTAYELLGSPEAVELSFDPDLRLIGIRSIDASNPRSYLVRRMGTSNTFQIAGRAFLLHWGIDTSVALRYSASLESEYLTIDIKQKGVDVTGVRSRFRNAVGIRSRFKNSVK